MNCYLNITVVDNEINQDKEAPIVLTTINCDGVKRFWNADDIEEFHYWWWDEEYDGPAAEDEVLEFIVNGERVDVGIFNDIVTVYGFDKEKRLFHPQNIRKEPIIKIDS